MYSKILSYETTILEQLGLIVSGHTTAVTLTLPNEPVSLKQKNVEEVLNSRLQSDDPSKIIELFYKSDHSPCGYIYGKGERFTDKNATVYLFHNVIAKKLPDELQNIPLNGFVWKKNINIFRETFRQVPRDIIQCYNSIVSVKDKMTQALRQSTKAKSLLFFYEVSRLIIGAYNLLSENKSSDMEKEITDIYSHLVLNHELGHFNINAKIGDAAYQNLHTYFSCTENEGIIKVLNEYLGELHVINTLLNISDQDMFKKNIYIYLFKGMQKLVLSTASSSSDHAAALALATLLKIIPQQDPHDKINSIREYIINVLQQEYVSIIEAIKNTFNPTTEELEVINWDYLAKASKLDEQVNAQLMQKSGDIYTKIAGGMTFINPAPGESNTIQLFNAILMDEITSTDLSNIIKGTRSSKINP